MANYKVVDADRLDADLGKVADSIRAKSGTSEALAFPDGFSSAVENIETGGGGGNAGGEEWFNDGDTHIWITLHEGRTSPMLGVCPKGTVTVDWGDGTTPDVLTGTSTYGPNWTPRHEYAQAGNYIITLATDGEIGFMGDSQSGAYILRYDSTTDARRYVYQNAIKRVELGSSVTVIGRYAFNFCYSLASVIIPDGVKSIDYSAFSSCYSLGSVVIPDSVTSIGSSVFYQCYSLASVIIPDGVKSIDSSMFFQCRSARYFSFANHTAVPTLSNTNAFRLIPSDCEIRVPAALYDKWIAATNWSTYASNIVAV